MPAKEKDKITLKVTKDSNSKTLFQAKGNFQFYDNES